MPRPVTAVGIQNPASPTASEPSVAPKAAVGTTVIPIGTQGTAANAAVTDPFLAQLDSAISVSSRRFLTANVHSPWQIFHGLLALKQEFQLNLGSSKVNAIQWIATSEPRFDNQPLLLKTPHGGKFHAFTRPYAFEGHPAQFLALLSQSDLPIGFAFKVGNDRITILDIINNTMKEVNSREEVTWVLWALQHYLKPDAQWVNQANEPWSMERLVQIETSAPVVGAPCGGNHRLFALTRIRDKHLSHGGKLVGIWAHTDHKIRQHIEIARSLQNSDGSFSAKFYETSGFTNDLNQRFNTTGHTMEFLSIALPPERLNEPWVRSAISTLCNDLLANRQRQIDCGPLYHTLNSLIIYRERITAKENRPSPSTEPVPGPLAAQGVVKSVTGPAQQPTPVLLPNVNPTVPSKPAVISKSVPTNPTDGQLTTSGEPLKPTLNPAITLPAKAAQPSVEALNELKLDGEFRDRLNALNRPRPVPSASAADSTALPKVTLGEPLLQAVEYEPVSALTPENK